MKLLVATCADNNVIKEYARYTLQIQDDWAKKWKADYLILNDPAYSRRAMWNYRTLIFYELFKKYDRILYIDADIIINKDCPNLFEKVPYDTIGVVTEDKGSRKNDRRRRIKRVNAHFGDIGWKKDYFNMGFYIVSKPHRDIFQRLDGKLWENRGWDASFYTYQIMRLGYKWTDLGYKWNHMSMFSEEWNGSPSRFDSHIIHYAGAGEFPDKGERTRTQLIADDVKKIYGAA